MFFVNIFYIIFELELNFRGRKLINNFNVNEFDFVLQIEQALCNWITSFEVKYINENIFVPN